MILTTLGHPKHDPEQQGAKRPQESPSDPHFAFGSGRAEAMAYVAKAKMIDDLKNCIANIIDCKRSISERLKVGGRSCRGLIGLYTRDRVFLYVSSVGWQVYY
jgi:hypothetical protein